MVTNADTGKARGYAFIEYEHERDMHCKYLSDTLIATLNTFANFSEESHHKQFIDKNPEQSQTQKKKEISSEVLFKFMFQVLI